MSARSWLYWAATIWLTLQLAIGGAVDLVRGREIVVIGQPVELPDHVGGGLTRDRR